MAIVLCHKDEVDKRSDASEYGGKGSFLRGSSRLRECCREYRHQDLHATAHFLSLPLLSLCVTQIERAKAFVGLEADPYRIEQLHAVELFEEGNDPAKDMLYHS